MARQRNPNRDKAYKLWLKSKERPLVDIAKELGERPSTVRKWKSQDNWERSDSKGSAPIKKQRSVRVNDPPQLVIDNDDMTEQQKLFCLYYLECFNATKAYQKAYGCEYSTASTEGSRSLVNPKIKRELHRLKAELQSDIFLDVKDLIKEYVKQAFVDITDFTEFGKREVPVMGMFGPVKDEDGRELMKEINYVDFKESTEVDGKLIKEVKVGKDGVSVKLYDKQKAMSELMKYLGGDRLREVQIAAAIAKNKDGSEEFDMEDDGFLVALEAEGEKLWPEE
ncbi:terminase small subunit [Enterococcus gallinarum]|uniref:terminase small subunit n=1 Tax=Enterococcus gallinarum TaxID=1353 RepID=UPI00289223AF|nr:terminase small subunit [Enterococcus gallinarum]MDT2701520.1 terminase small subunit [Enterococcus gallinarum]